MTQIEWPRTIWSEARQINNLNGWPDMPGDQAVPAAFFRALRADAREREAALFLAQALPRYEAIAWAAGVIDRIPEAQSAAVRAAIDAVRAWLADPNEENRRATGDCAGPTDPPAAATLCALAAFHSGGSVAPPDQPPVPPARGATGRFAGAAVIAAAVLSGHTAETLKRALDEGERIAAAKMENA